MQAFNTLYFIYTKHSLQLYSSDMAAHSLRKHVTDKYQTFKVIVYDSFASNNTSYCNIKYVNGSQLYERNTQQKD